MSRLIDADALPNELFKKHVHDGEELEPMLYFEDAVKVVDNAPTIDAIPVEWLNNVMLNCDDEDAKAAWRILHKWNNDHFADFGKMENV